MIILYDFIRILNYNFFLFFLILNIISIFRRINLSDKLKFIFVIILVFSSISGLVLFFLNFEDSKSRFFGEYAITSWFMLLSVSLSPFVLINRKIRKYLISFLIVTFLMNIGRLFEIFVILTTAIHRDNL